MIASLALGCLSLSRPATGPAIGAKKTCVAMSDSGEFCYGLPGVVSFPGPFDPFNFLEEANEETVRLWRESELVHGRVAMLATVGFLVQESYHPLFGGTVTGPAISHIPQIPQFFWFFLTLVIGICESYRIQISWVDPRTPSGMDPSRQWKLMPDYTPGHQALCPEGALAWRTHLRRAPLQQATLGLIPSASSQMTRRLGSTFRIKS